jgi:hypothetical protein
MHLMKQNSTAHHIIHLSACVFMKGAITEAPFLVTSSVSM